MIRFLQVVLGLMFVTSGLAKGLTPFISVMKLDEYLLIAGLDWFVRFDYIILVLLNATEVTLGVMLMFNIWPKLSLWVATLLMVVFTPKTLYVAIKGLMEYSGCYGGLFPVTPWLSHWKNVFMDVILIILWIKRGELYKLKLKANPYVVVVSVALAMVLMQVLILIKIF